MINTDIGFVISMLLFAMLTLYDMSILLSSKYNYNANALFINIHIISIALFFLYKSSLLHQMDFYTLSILFLYTFFFPIGYSLGRGGRQKIKKEEVFFRRDRVETLYKINNIGFMLFVLAYSYELYMANWNPPLLASDKLSAYYDFPQRFIHYLVMIGIPISGIYIYISEHFLYKKRQIYTRLVIIFIAFVMMMARAVALTQLFTIIFFFFKERKIVLNFRRILYVVIFTLLFITFSGTLRTGDSNRVLLEIGGLDSWPTWSLPFAWIYLYFTTSIENFRYYVSLHDGNFRYGVFSFLLPVQNLLQLKESIFFDRNLPNTSAGGFNTSGYYLDVYLDFGIMGFIYTFILGYVSARIFYSRNFLLYLFSSYWLYAIFTSSMNGYFNAFFTFVYLGYYYIVIKLSMMNFFRVGSMQSL